MIPLGEDVATPLSLSFEVAIEPIFLSTARCDPFLE